jgi:hypothetical protein
MRLIVRVLAALVASGLSTAALAENRALVVGINKYPHITENGRAGMLDLQGAVRDAEGYARFLTEHFGFRPEQVRLLIDEEATREAIVRGFEDWLIAGSQPGDRVVFFFAGHGAQVDDLDGDEALIDPDDKYDEALAPADAAGELTKGPVQLTNLLIDDEINEMLQRLEGREVKVVVDACHAGTITRSLDGAVPSGGKVRARTLTPRSPALTRGTLNLPDAVRRAHKVRTRLIDVSADSGTPGAAKVEPIVWTATASSQLALDLVDGGVFTQAFIDGLVNKKADANGDGEVTAAELRNYLVEVSEAVCKQNAQICRSGLTPTVEAPEEYYGEILFPFASVGKTNAAPVKTSDTYKSKADAYAAKAEPYVEKAEAYVEKAEAYFTHKNDFDLKVEILPSTTPKLDSDVRFRVTSSQPGTLFLLDQAPDGVFTQVYPNKFGTAQGRLGAIRANAPLTVPDAYAGFGLTASPRGKGTLLALVVEDAAKFEKVLTQNIDLQALKEPGKLLDALAKQLYAPLETKSEEPNRRLHWSYARVDYEVK